MATEEQIREGLATNLSTIPGAQVSAYILASPTPPAFHVIPGEIAYDQAMGSGVHYLTYTVQGFVAFGSDKGTQIRLGAWRARTGNESVKLALEADKTLGGVVKDLHVQSCSEPSVLTLSETSAAAGGGRQLLSVDWTVLILD